MISGVILSLSVDIIKRFPWTYLLIPPLLSFRGSIMGILVGRVSTGIHLGTINPSIRRNTPHFYSLLISTYILRFAGVTMIILLTSILSLIIYKALLPIIKMFIIILASLELSYIIVLLFSMSICNAAYRFGIDPDYVLYPSTSSIADVISISIFIIMIYIYNMLNSLTPLCIIIILSYLFLILVIKGKTIIISEIYKTIREAFISIVLVAIIVSSTAVLFKELMIPSLIGVFILLIYPSFLTTTGDAGCIFGSKLTTKLHIGEIGVKLRDLLEMIRLITPILISYIIMLTLYGGVYPLILYANLKLIFTSFLPVTILAGLLSIAIITMLNLLITNVTFRIGLDPDHFINPLISSLSDYIGTLSLLTIIGILS